MLNFSCIRTLDEYEMLSRLVERIRITVSYAQFNSRLEHQQHQDDTQSTQSSSESQSSSSFGPIAAAPPSIYMLRIWLYVVIMLVSLVGNMLVILVIAFNRFMHKPANYFILNLAVCDLAILFSCMWVQIAQSVDDYWTLGEQFCKVLSCSF